LATSCSSGASWTSVRSNDWWAFSCPERRLTICSWVSEKSRYIFQRNTPQTETCDACHGNAGRFLTADDVLPAELEANKGIIVEEIPPAIGGGN
jgi:hypothetical protein